MDIFNYECGQLLPGFPYYIFYGKGCCIVYLNLREIRELNKENDIISHWRHNIDNENMKRGVTFTKEEFKNFKRSLIIKEMLK